MVGLITEADGGYYDSVIYPPLQLPDEKNSAKAVQAGCNQIRDLLLPILQKYPNQWYQFTPLNRSGKEKSSSS